MLNASEFAAHSWPGGDIFVTCGLMDQLNDDELAAAIAHELGHLINDGHLRTVSSLKGCRTSLDSEARADATGVELLRSRGIDPNAMIRMLNKVQGTPELNPSCKRAICRRIQLLQSPR